MRRTALVEEPRHIYLTQFAAENSDCGMALSTFLPFAVERVNSLIGFDWVRCLVFWFYQGQYFLDHIRIAQLRVRTKPDIGRAQPGLKLKQSVWNS